MIHQYAPVNVDTMFVSISMSNESWRRNPCDENRLQELLEEERQQKIIQRFGIFKSLTLNDFLVYCWQNKFITCWFLIRSYFDFSHHAQHYNSTRCCDNFIAIDFTGNKKKRIIKLTRLMVPDEGGPEEHLSLIHI